MRPTFSFIAPGDAGTMMTLASMRRLARKEMMDPLVRQTAVRIAGGFGRDGTSQAVAIRHWLADHVQFTRDPRGVELLHGPRWMIHEVLSKGVVYVDCDDAAILAAALGLSVGLRARYVLVGFHTKNAPYQHVWAELSAPSTRPAWVEMDVTRTSQDVNVLTAISRRLSAEV